MWNVCILPAIVIAIGACFGVMMESTIRVTTLLSRCLWAGLTIVLLLYLIFYSVVATKGAAVTSLASALGGRGMGMLLAFVALCMCLVAGWNAGFLLSRRSKDATAAYRAAKAMMDLDN